MKWMGPTKPCLASWPLPPLALNSIAHKAMAMLVGGGILLSQCGRPGVPHSPSPQCAPPSLLPAAGNSPRSPAIPSAQLGQLTLLYGAPRLYF